MKLILLNRIYLHQKKPFFGDWIMGSRLTSQSPFLFLSHPHLLSQPFRLKSKQKEFLNQNVRTSNNEDQKKKTN
jgi:hypothetical protein